MVISLAAGLLCSALIGVLVAVYGQPTAAAWAGTGAAVLSLLLTIVGLVSVRRPITGGLSNPA